MTNTEITALAREYAEEEYAQSDYDNAEEKEQQIEFMARSYEAFLYHLLRRFYLVEKECVNEAYKGAIETIRLGEETGAYSLCTFGSARRILLVSFFPELGKEAEGEEMLTVERKRVQNLYDSHKLRGHHLAGEALIKLFGSKCLPDEKDATSETKDATQEVKPTEFGRFEPKPAEPKFKVNDVVRTVFNETTHITSVLENGNYYLYGKGNEYPEDSLTLIQPYIEPVGTKDDTKAPTFTDERKSQCKSPDRLRIAAMLAAGMLANEEVSCFTDVQELEHMDFITHHAFEYADKLIKRRKRYMNYDITFCEGEGCKRREECHRYRELLRFRADKDPNKRTYISMCRPDPNKCTLFWSEKGAADGN